MKEKKLCTQDGGWTSSSTLSLDPERDIYQHRLLSAETATMLGSQVQL